MSSLLDKVIRYSFEGKSVGRIAVLTGLSRIDVVSLRDDSPSWREHLASKQDLRIERDEADRRRRLSDIARAQRFSLLASKRGPDGRIDWPSVRGYEPWSEMIEVAG